MIWKPSIVAGLIALTALAAGALLPSGSEPAQAQGVTASHYLYTCDGYAYDATAHRYTLPTDCHADPNIHPATHSWLTNQIPLILRGDGRTRQATLLNATVTVGSRGRGRTHLDSLRDGVIAADYHFQGCNPIGRSAGWAVGDHELNPYRNFGYWSYWQYDWLWGYRGAGFATFAPRRTGACGIAPSVRTNAARMADEFSARAERAWRAHQPGEAMFNLGIALHLVEDVSVPSHAHPETLVSWFGKQDVFPAWANVHKSEHAIGSGGRYRAAGRINGVSVGDSPGGFVYAMAAESFPYFPYQALTATAPAGLLKCDVTTDPEHCPTESSRLLEQAQSYSTGYVGFFLDRVGYR